MNAPLTQREETTRAAILTTPPHRACDVPMTFDSRLAVLRRLAPQAPELLARTVAAAMGNASLGPDALRHLAYAINMAAGGATRTPVETCQHANRLAEALMGAARARSL